MLLCFKVQQKASEQRTKAHSLSWSLPLSLSEYAPLCTPFTTQPIYALFGPMF